MMSVLLEKDVQAWGSTDTLGKHMAHHSSAARKPYDTKSNKSYVMGGEELWKSELNVSRMTEPVIQSYSHTVN